MGSGLFGSVFAQQAIARGKSVIIIDKRDHIGGNVFTDKVGDINIHMYGPHVFHTDSIDIWKYVNKYASFDNYIHRPKVKYKDSVYSFPINLLTLHQLWGINTPEEGQKKLQSVRLEIDNPANLEEWSLSQVGEEIYSTFIRGYTKKQWKRDPKELPASIIKRLPIRFTFDDNYFNHRYQGIPTQGYTHMVENMIDGVPVELGTDYYSRDDWIRYAHTILFTGRIDEYYNRVHGSLPYRSLTFQHELHKGDYQGASHVNYTEESVPYTRITEHKHFERTDSNNTIITFEYPENEESDSDPYYPIDTAKNRDIYNKYRELTLQEKDTIFGGRLAEYKYYDMHQVIGAALQKAKTIL